MFQRIKYFIIRRITFHTFPLYLKTIPQIFEYFSIHSFFEKKKRNEEKKKKFIARFRLKRKQDDASLTAGYHLYTENGGAQFSLRYGSEIPFCMRRNRVQTVAMRPDKYSLGTTRVCAAHGTRVCRPDVISRLPFLAVHLFRINRIPPIQLLIQKIKF